MIRGGLVVIAVAMLAPDLVLAQEWDTPTVLEEVIVTAQRRSQNLLEVPIAVTVLDAEDIRNSGAFELSQLADYVPNLYINQNNDRGARVVVRGVGSFSRNIGFDTRVGVYLDGVYLGQSPAVNQDVFDLEHVEVLRGPQGTLFGKNSVAGAVLLVSKQPQPEFAADVSVNVYNYDGLNVRGMINLPLGDVGAIRLHVSDRDHDGFITNVYSPDHLPGTINIVHPELGPIFDIPLCDSLGSNTPPGCLGGPVGPNQEPTHGETYLGQDVTSWRAQLSLWPTERWDIRLSLDGLNGTRSVVGGDSLSDALGATVDRFAPDPLEVSVSKAGLHDRDISGASLQVDFLPGNDHRIRSITALRDTEYANPRVGAGSAFDYYLVSYLDTYEQFTQELQWISPDDSPFTWLVGLYYYDQDSSTDRPVTIGNAGWVLGIAPGLELTNRGVLSTKSIAGYTNGLYEFNDRWSLGVGYRYTKVDKDTHWFGSAAGLPPAFGLGSTPPGGYIDSISENDSSPSVHLSYLTQGEKNIYAGYASGFKSGGFNLDGVSQETFDNIGITFDKETVDSFELGLKGYFLEDTLFLRAAAFVADYDDYQVFQFVDLGFDPELGGQATSITLDNAAKVETDGLEIEAQWAISDNFSIDGFLGLLDAKFKDYPGGSTMNVVDPEFPGGIRRVPVNAAGKKLPEAPGVTAGLGFSYSMPLTAFPGTLHIRLDALYTGGYYTTVNNEKTRMLPGTHPVTFAFDYPSYGISHEVPFGYVEDVTILNGRVTLVDDGGRWDVALWGRNITDEGGYTRYGRDFLGTLLAAPRTPRMYGIEMAYHFR